MPHYCNRLFDNEVSLVVALDDFDQILEGIRLFKAYFGDVDIPVKFEVPKDDFWPSSLHGLRLGKRLEKLLTASGRISRIICIL